MSEKNKKTKKNFTVGSVINSENTCEINDKLQPINTRFHNNKNIKVKIINLKKINAHNKTNNKINHNIKKYKNLLNINIETFEKIGKMIETCAREIKINSKQKNFSCFDKSIQQLNDAIECMNVNEKEYREIRNKLCSLEEIIVT